MLLHPLEQFETYILTIAVGLGGVDCYPITFTNVTMFCILLTLVIRAIFGMLVWVSYGALNIVVLIINEIYKLIKNVLKNNTNLRRSQYFAALFFLFLFLLSSNMVGLIPYTFTITSSFVTTFFLSASYFIGINLIGFIETQWKTLVICLPGGVPLPITPFLSSVESVSYVAKVFSLSIRLFANMMSGHALLKILTGFSWNLMRSGPLYIIIAVIPWLVVTIIFFLEFLIGYLQAYVFTILVAIYINDILVQH